MNYYLGKMIELNADRIDFMGIGEILKNSSCNNKAYSVYESYTKEEFKNVDSFPKTCYRYWKIIDGEKVYID